MDNGFGIGILPFTNLKKPDLPTFVDQVESWPIMICIGAPGDPLIVNGYGPSDPQLNHCGLDVVQIFFIGELWSMYADNHQPLIGILGVPLLKCGNYIAAVDTAIGPKFDHYDFPVQFG